MSVLDEVVEANRALLHERSQVGIAKYGVTLSHANLTEREFLTHALEETLDLANYLQAALQRGDERESYILCSIKDRLGIDTDADEKEILLAISALQARAIGGAA